MIELTQKQQEAVDTVIDRYEEGYLHTIIAGYAGTGKTTCIKNQELSIMTIKTKKR